MNLQSNKISNIIELYMIQLMAPELLPPGIVIKRKAGIWQGIDSYKDMNMFIIRDVNIEIPIPDDLGLLIEAVNPDMPWSEIHFQERISGEPLNPGESYKQWPYAQFKEANDAFKKVADQQFDHSYMERFWARKAAGTHYKVNHLDKFEKRTQGIRFDYGDLNDVINQLIENPLTRQAYLPIFFPEDTGAKDNMRVPCTIGYLFEIFDNKLDITYYIRSCDAFRHLRNDIFLACRLTQHVKKELLLNGIKDIETGKLQMKIANLHIFENDLYAFKQKEKKIKYNGTNK